LDESFDSAESGLFVVGGVLGQGVALFELERKWERLRKKPEIDIAYFKASECQHGRGEFAKFAKAPGSPTAEERKIVKPISHQFLSLIGHEDVTIHGVGVPQDDFYEVIKDKRAREILGGSPYRLAYDLAMIQCAWLMKQVENEIKIEKAKKFGDGPTRKYVAFVCDEHEEHSKNAESSYRHLRDTNPAAAAYMASFAMMNDKDSEVLQAADAAAYEIRWVLSQSFKQRQGPLRQQFNILTDKHKVALITHATKDQLQHIVATSEPGQPFQLDALMNMQLNENIFIAL